MKVGVAIVDLTAGMYATIAILAALHERARSGLGQFIDMALLDAQVAWLANVGSNFLVSGERPARYGNAHPNIVPYQPFPTADGWLAVGVGNDRQWQRLCALAGWDDLMADERFASNPLRVHHRDVLVPMLRDRFQTRTTAVWRDALLEAGIPCGPINTIDQVFADPQVSAREMMVELPHPLAGSVKLAGSPFKFSRTPVRLAQHTAEVLTEHLGYSPDQVGRLCDEGIVQVSPDRS
jgi:formyl-CoA transferase